MSSKEFDHIIRNKLNNLSAPMPDNSWSMFESKFQASKIDAHMDSIMDAQIAEKLNSYKVPFQNEYWHDFVNQALQPHIWKQQIRRLKVLEMAMLVLLLISLYSYLPQNEVEKINYQVAIAENVTSENEVVEIQSPKVASASKEAIINQAEHLDEESPEVEYIPSKRVPTIRQVRLEAVLPIETKQQGSVELSFVNLNRQVSRQLTVDNISALPSLDIEGVSTLALSEVPPFKEKEVAPYWRLSVMGGGDFNRVITPETHTIDGQVLSADRFVIGYSGGMGISRKKGRFEFGIAAIYAAIQYNPLQILKLEGSLRDGYYGESYKFFELNTLQLPTTARFDLVSGNWSMYLNAGASFNSVVQANYYIADAVAFESDSFSPSITGSRSSNKSLRDAIEPGIFEGGAFIDNVWLSASAGMGIERSLNKHYSLFTNASFTQSFKYFNNEGIGPYNDKFHNLRITTGLKINLK